MHRSDDRAALIARVRDYLDHEVDDGDRAELEGLVAVNALDELGRRFSGLPTFGTAGIRGVIPFPRSGRFRVMRATRSLLS